MARSLLHQVFIVAAAAALGASLHAGDGPDRVPGSLAGAPGNDGQAGIVPAAGDILALSVTCTGPAAALQREQVQYLITVANGGDGPAHETRVVHLRAPGLSFAGEASPPGTQLESCAAGAVSWRIDVLDPGATVTIELDLLVSDSAGGALASAAVVVPDGPGDDSSDNVHVLSLSVPPGPAAVINEILADPAFGAGGDANGDGVLNPAQDEFVEIVNGIGTALDLAGWTLRDASAVRHVFPAGTTLAGSCAVVVFGGGQPGPGFGGALVQVASSGQLNLGNQGDNVVLTDAGGTSIAQVTYGAEAGSDQSITRDPDVLGPLPLVPHGAAQGSGGAAFSPGTRINTSSFAGCGPLEPCPADTNDDGVVDVLDLIAVVLSFGQAGVAADIDQDGIVDEHDLDLLIDQWGCQG